MVVARGGYDAVSAEKLAWRKLGQDFNLGTNNLPALAFSLKTAYYKNLAAYEIVTVHKRTPPPREILEDISARGGSLLTRTLENFRPHTNRESGQINGDEMEDSAGEEQKVQKEDGVDTEDGNGASPIRRALRVAPPQRVPFQPDLTPGRQVRHAAANTSPSQPTTVSTVNGLNLPLALANYEPRPPNPLTLRPVITPGNNPTLFRERARASREAQDGKQGILSTSNKGVILPGKGFIGPNVYVRALHALRSGIPEEQDYALHHLVRISHQHPDKFKFDIFPNLAEGLIAKILEIGSLFYQVNWRITHDESEFSRDLQCLNGLGGTPDIMRRIEAAGSVQTNFGLQTEDFCHRLANINQAGLVVRNMVMQEENAEYLAQIPIIKDLLTIVLHLPSVPIASELQQYALDIAEQLTRYFVLPPDDPLYKSLLAHLLGDDRGKIITVLRALTCMSMDREEPNRLNEVPVSTIERICDWTMLDDEELVMACLEFLHQFTAFVDNMEAMIDQIRWDGLLTQLTRLLLHGAKDVETKVLIEAPAEEPEVELDDQAIMELPQELTDELLKFEEPERTTHWLQALFQPDLGYEITQINLWTAYQSQFSKITQGTPMLQAQEFIKHITNVFQRTAAQITHPPEGGSRFVIKGLRCRQLPKDPQGRVYQRCLWRVGPDKECGVFAQEPSQMYEHVICAHYQGHRKEDGKWDLAEVPSRRYICQWGGCGRFGPEGTTSLFEAGMHLKMHLPRKAIIETIKPDGKGGSQDPLAGAEYRTHHWLMTATDELGNPTGLPMASVMVLKNIARSVAKLETLDGEVSWVEKLFLPIESRLWNVMGNNRALFGKMSEVIEIVCDRKPVRSG
ncbi:MAG: Chromatin structure-remodeling complex protein rsc9 [Peltula sp. TS41687]|nr:MAG: Chromatin structure-remodeling complex protein rsc9 [Peltula sp. TS41687]